ncbi:CRE-PQN-48 protein [Aphelenchoides avenae]|nr:CRE-PQN-48 protein [Aphelenchus avenae]
MEGRRQILHTLLLVALLAGPISGQRQAHEHVAPQSHVALHRAQQAPSSCDVPPDFWCDSQEIAQRCNVLQQCDSFRRSRQPITVTLMFEALCPFCQRFITNHLSNLYNQYHAHGVEFELVPFGNARLLRNGQISCNHGQKECDANRLLGCVIDVVRIKQAIPFMVCFERAVFTSDFQQAFDHCSGFIRNAYGQIRQCYTGERGRQLQLQAAHKTMSVRPHPIVEVPYIVINNYSPNLDGNQINIAALTHLLQKWVNLKRR